MKVTSQPTASSLKHAKQVYENGGTTALYAQVRSGRIRPQTADIVISESESLGYRVKVEVSRLIGQFSAIRQ